MKQQIISLLERAKENGTTIGDVLAEVRGMRPVCLTCDDHGAVGNILDTVQCPDCSQHAESKLEWIATPDIRDVPDCVLTPRGVALKQSQISVAEEAQDVKLPEIPSAYNDTGGYVGYAKSDLAAYARAAVMADRASRPARPEPTDAELATLASEFMMSGSCSTRYYFDDRGFARALLARYGAQPAASAEPVAFYKDGVLFWHGEHAAWRGKDGQLYAEPTAALASAPVAGEAQSSVRSLQRYGFGYADDGNGGRYLSSLKRDDGAFLLRDDVIAALASGPAAQPPQDSGVEMVSMGGTAPAVPRWLLDAAQRIQTYMDAHSPGAWAVGGIQKRKTHAADGRDAKDAVVASIQAAIDGMRFDYFNATPRQMEFIKAGARLVIEAVNAAIAAQQGEGGA